jgi:hypothetical protein
LIPKRPKHKYIRAHLLLLHVTNSPTTYQLIALLPYPYPGHHRLIHVNGSIEFIFQANEADFLSLIEAPRAKAVAIYSRYLPPFNCAAQSSLMINWYIGMLCLYGCSGRIKLGGSHELFQTLKPLFQEVRKQVLADRVEAARRLPRRHPGALVARRGALIPTTTGGTATMDQSTGSMPKPIFKDQIEWMADELVDLCGNCGQSFFILRRRHHCRVCGGVFCHECSSYLVDKKRTCLPCFEDIKAKIAAAVRRGNTPTTTAATSRPPRAGFRPRSMPSSHTPKTVGSPILSGTATPSNGISPAHQPLSQTNGPDGIPSLRVRTSSDNIAEDGKVRSKHIHTTASVV